LSHGELLQLGPLTLKSITAFFCFVLDFEIENLIVSSVGAV